MVRVMDKMPVTSDSKQPAEGAKCPVPWYAKLGVYAFMFFLIKGLLWLTVPAVLAYLASR